MDQRNPKGVNEAIHDLEKLFDVRAVVKSNSYNRQLSQQEETRLIQIKVRVFECLDLLRDAID